MDEENKIKIILKTLEMIKKQKVGQQGQYFDNIFEICSKEHGWDREDTLAAINAAKNGNVITEVPNNGKSPIERLIERLLSFKKQRI